MPNKSILIKITYNFLFLFFFNINTHSAPNDGVCDFGEECGTTGYNNFDCSTCPSTVAIDPTNTLFTFKNGTTHEITFNALFNNNVPKGTGYYEITFYHSGWSVYPNLDDPTYPCHFNYSAANYGLNLECLINDNFLSYIKVGAKGTLNCNSVLQAAADNKAGSNVLKTKEKISPNIGQAGIVYFSSEQYSFSSRSDFNFNLTGPMSTAPTEGQGIGIKYYCKQVSGVDKTIININSQNTDHTNSCISLVASTYECHDFEIKIHRIDAKFIPIEPKDPVVKDPDEIQPENISSPTWRISVIDKSQCPTVTFKIDRPTGSHNSNSSQSFLVHWGDNTSTEVVFPPAPSTMQVTHKYTNGGEKFMAIGFNFNGAFFTEWKDEGFGLFVTNNPFYCECAHEMTHEFVDRAHDHGDEYIIYWDYDNEQSDNSGWLSAEAYEKKVQAHTYNYPGTYHIYVKEKDIRWPLKTKYYTAYSQYVTICCNDVCNQPVFRQNKGNSKVYPNKNTGIIELLLSD